MTGAISVPLIVGPSLLRPVLLALTLVALSEMLVLRVLTRTAVFIPGIGERVAVVSAIGELGQLAYSISVILSGLALLLVADLAWTAGRAGRMLAIGLVGFAMVALMARWGWLERIAADGVTLAAFVVVAVAVRQARPMGAVAFATFCAALILAAVDGIWRNLAGGAHVPAAGGVLLSVAEWLVFGASLAAIAAHRPMERGAGMVGAILGAALLVAALVAPASLRILLLWNVGLPGALPAAAYGVIAFAVGLTVASAVRRGRLVLAVGMVLLLVGGIGLQSTYQSGLVLVGLATIALRYAIEVEPWLSAAEGVGPARAEGVRPGPPPTAPPIMGEEVT